MTISLTGNFCGGCHHVRGGVTLIADDHALHRDGYFDHSYHSCCCVVLNALMMWRTSWTIICVCLKVLVTATFGSLDMLRVNGYVGTIPT